MKLLLTQFITYKLKASTSSKITYLRNVKNNGSYSPYTDYWRQLRQAIALVANNIENMEYLYTVVENADERYKDNYYRDVSRFINYVKKNNVKFISVSKAKWTYKDLIVTASPEVGMKIGDEEYSVKIYYKVKKETEKWLAKNIAPTLNLMRSANPMEKKTFAILNLQNGRLYSEDKFSRDPLELEVDADTLLDIWQKI